VCSSDPKQSVGIISEQDFGVGMLLLIN